MKTITAWEIQKGTKVQVKCPKTGKRFEMWVDYVKRNEETLTVNVWGSWVIDGISASEACILVEEQ